MPDTAPPPDRPPRWIDYVDLDTIEGAEVNPKDHDDDGIDRSIEAFGYVEVPTVDERTGRLVAGHGRVARLRARRAAGLDAPDGVTVDDDGRWLVPLERGWSSVDDAHAAAYLLASNRLTETGGWLPEPLPELLTVIGDDLLPATGFTADDLAALVAALDDPTPGGRDPATRESLLQRFVVPPFSVLDARQGYWKERRAAWLRLGIRSELGRGEGDTATPGKGRPSGDGTIARLPAAQLGADGRTVPGDGRGRAVATSWRGSARGRTFTQDRMKGESSIPDRRAADRASNVTGAPRLPAWADNSTEHMAPGTSIFDPVLCEIAYRWFCPPGGTVLDPFAGGSVRGVVASLLGRPYIGVDLRDEQVVANREQADAICNLTTAGDPAPTPGWITGDSRYLDDLVPASDVPAVDLVFSCPPYYDLEVYSDDPADLSNAGDYADFLDAFRGIVDRAADRLADDRFMVLVVSEVRDRHGIFHGLVPDTIRAGVDAGLRFYNDAVLINNAGSLPLRAGRQFDASRKLGRTHQAFVVFVKGDPVAATAAIGAVERGDPPTGPDDVDEPDEEEISPS